MAELKNRQWLLAARPDGLIKEERFSLERGHRLAASGWAGPRPQSRLLLRSDSARMDVDGHLYQGHSDWKCDARGNRRAGCRVEAAGHREGRLGARPARMGRLHHQRWQGPHGIAEASGGNRPAASAVVARHHRTYRILRHAIGRKCEGGRNVRRIGRGRRDRLGRGHDREGQRMPRHRHRGRPRQMRMADERSGLRRRHRL